MNRILYFYCIIFYIIRYFDTKNIKQENIRINEAPNV